MGKIVYKDGHITVWPSKAKNGECICPVVKNMQWSDLKRMLQTNKVELDSSIASRLLDGIEDADRESTDILRDTLGAMYEGMYNLSLKRSRS